VATASASGGAPHRLIGRTEVLEGAERLFEGLRAGRGGGLLLRGPGGMGKTEALRACAIRAHALGLRVLSSRAVPSELPSPYSLLAGFRPWDSERGGRPSPGIFPVPALLSHPADLSPERLSTGTVPGEMEALLPPIAPTAAGRLGTARGEQLVRLVDGIVDRTREGPLLLAIDDLTLADGASLEVVRRLGERLDDVPLGILGTVGTEAPAQASTRSQLERFARLPAVRTIELRPLTVEELAEFASLILDGGRPTIEEVVRWHAETDGNPLVVEQLLLGSDRFEGSDRFLRERLVNLVESVRGRAQGLPPPVRRVLAYATVLGREVAPKHLVAATGLAPGAIDEALDALLRVGILRRRDGPACEFVSEEARGALYAEMTETRRRILHRRVAAALEASGDGSDTELARHFYLGRDDAKAIEYNVRASRAAARALAFETAIAHLQRVLGVERRSPSPDRRREIRTLTEIGRLSDELGELGRSESALIEAVALAPADPALDPERGRALLGLATTRLDRGEFQSAQALATEAHPLLERSGTPADRLAARRVLGAVAWRVGDLPRAEVHQRAALALAEQSGTPLERGHAMIDLANTLVERGPDQFPAALGLYAKAAALFAQGDDHGARARVEMNRACLEFWVGRNDEALRDIEQALREAERSRSPIWIGYCLLNRAQWEAQLGRPDDAERSLEQAEQATHLLGDRLVEEQIAMTRGMICEARERPADAREQFERALGLARELGLIGEIPELLVRSARLLLRAGEVAEARRRLTEARGLGLVEVRSDLGPVLRELDRALGPTAR
jgi:tetratricopeptide (TPR) repeat protein